MVSKERIRPGCRFQSVLYVSSVFLDPAGWVTGRTSGTVEFVQNRLLPWSALDQKVSLFYVVL